ncbi:MAG: RNA polymerase sigma factor [Aestuariibaculum sp.]
MTPTNLNIEQLVQACKSGNKLAQLEIYNRYYKAMYNTSVRIVKDRFEAEDIMQDSFLMAFTKLDTLKDLTLFGSWLKRIVVNNSIYHYNKNLKKHEENIDAILYKVEAKNEDETHFDFTNLRAREILTTMKTLKDSYRVALTLNLIEGYDNEEISDIMNITNANCRTLISRAKDSLRKKLQISQA